MGTVQMKGSSQDRINKHVLYKLKTVPRHLMIHTEVPMQREHCTYGKDLLVFSEQDLKQLDQNQQRWQLVL